MLQTTLGYKIEAEQSLGIVTFLDLLNPAINAGLTLHRKRLQNIVISAEARDAP